MVVPRLDASIPRVAGPRDLLRRITRWFNLTVIHQLIWPVIVILSGSTLPGYAEASGADVLGMIVGPLAASIVAIVYLRRHVWQIPSTPVKSAVAEQARLVALGLPAMVLVGRLIAGDIETTLTIAVVGASSVAAYHLIHFGVVRSIFASPMLPVLLFGASWAIHGIATALAQDSEASYLLTAIGGFTAGLLVALGTTVIHRWPGGRLTAPALHWLVVYLIISFTG